MNTKHNHKKSVIAALGAAAAAVTAPAMPFAGVGTAQAASTLNTSSDAFGVTVEIHSTGSEGVCFYSAEPWFGWQTVKPLPVYKVPFYLQANETHNLWFPGIQTGPHGKRRSSAPSAALTFSTPLTEDSRGVVVVT